MRRCGQPRFDPASAHVESASGSPQVGGHSRVGVRDLLPNGAREEVTWVCLVPGLVGGLEVNLHQMPGHRCEDHGARLALHRRLELPVRVEPGGVAAQRVLAGPATRSRLQVEKRTWLRPSWRFRHLDLPSRRRHAPRLRRREASLATLGFSATFRTFMAARMRLSTWWRRRPATDRTSASLARKGAGHATRSGIGAASAGTEAAKTASAGPSRYHPSRPGSATSSSGAADQVRGRIGSRWRPTTALSWRSIVLK